MGEYQSLQYVRQVAVDGNMLFSLIDQKKPLQQPSNSPMGFCDTSIFIRSASLSGSISSYFFFNCFAASEICSMVNRNHILPVYMCQTIGSLSTTYHTSCPQSGLLLVAIRLFLPAVGFPGCLFTLKVCFHNCLKIGIFCFFADRSPGKERLIFSKHFF